MINNMDIDPIISKLRQDSSKILAFSEKFKTNNEIKKTRLHNGKIILCGVDGGFVSRQISSSALIIRRAVATCFEYDGTKLIDAKFFPQKRVDPEIIFESVDQSEFSIFSNLKRVEMEINTASEAVDKFKPNFLILDGSIVVHPSSVPNRNSKYYTLFLKVSEKIRELYKKCLENNVQLIGAVEDSNGRRFVDNDFMNDSNVLYHVLNEGEYVCPKRYSDNIDLPSLSELGEYSNQIKTTYLKVGKYDKPIRIDFLGKDVETITSIIYTYSRITSDYSYPSVLIEADARAKLTDFEFNIVYGTIRDKLGINPLIFELRRDKRSI